MLRCSSDALSARLAAPHADCEVEGADVNLGFARGSIVRFREDELPPLSEDEKAELRALAERPDSEIDYSDIPKVTDFSGWMTPEEARAYRAARQKNLVKT
jgi:hypothetical protein